MSIQRYDFYDDSGHCTNYKDRVTSRTGDFVSFTDYLNEMERLEAKESTHAAEVERLTGERDAAVRERDAAVEALASMENECISMGMPFMAENIRAALAKIEGERR